MKSIVGNAKAGGLLRSAMLVLGMSLTGLAASTGTLLERELQEKGKDQPAPLSDGERKAVEKINTAKDPEAKMKAAVDFMKKNSKSAIRGKVANYVAEQVSVGQNPQQIVSLCQNFISTFNTTEEGDLVRPGLVDALLKLEKWDEALSEGNQYLQRNPEDVTVLISIAWAGANQMQKQAATPKLTQAATEASSKAVELMEADKRPSRFDEKNWAEYRNSWLPRLYQARGLMLLNTGQRSDAKDNLEKAAGLEPYDPSTLMMLVNITNEEYQDLAKRYQAEKKGDILDKAVEKMDEVIDWMARAVGATDGNAQMQQINQQLRENLTAYYSFRHEGKTDGLNGLVDKYKKK
jgi:tetratricopeptide (TPR) repeat protein